MASIYYGTVGAIRFWECVDEELLNVDLFFSMIGETSPETLRYSLDRTLFIIKTNSEAARNYLKTRALELDIPYVEYTYEEMLAELQTPTWTEPIED